MRYIFNESAMDSEQNNAAVKEISKEELRKRMKEKGFKLNENESDKMEMSSTVVADARQRKIDRNNAPPRTESSGEHAVQDNFIGSPSEIARAKKIARNAHSVFIDDDGKMVREDQL